MPTFRYEKRLFKKGHKLIAGVDEVGRGCFAGPLVTGCVVFGPEFKSPATSGIIINDSKKMSPNQRENSNAWIKENAESWGIGEVSAQKINRMGMAKAAKIAFRMAISQARGRLGKPIDFLLADAFFISYVPGLPAKRRKDKKGRYYKKTNGRQLAIINGDEKSFSIAAASIVAKAHRDKLMQNLSLRPKYKKYGWGENKGYGTRKHGNAIKKYGITRQHRKAFVNTWLLKS
ncbi:MAG TPA: ribonuclease HII [Patescibacteria group bacterium]|nr:ribonuclease HII [Patescibacteria group bacterium]